MKDSVWEREFRAAYARAKSAYEAGAETPESCVAEEDRAFLAGIGCSVQELFDLVEDDVAMGEPGLESALQITGVRRDYFLREDDGKPPERIRHHSEFPPPGAALDGMPWLPRIIVKAQAKLRGELPPELMFSCGGDRHFLKLHGLTPEGFLRAVWEAGDDEERIVEWIRKQGGGA